eukprot:scaffold35407_cov17-Prasinocladus_malaysianus.AAC.1
MDVHCAFKGLVKDGMSMHGFCNLLSVVMRLRFTECVVAVLRGPRFSLIIVLLNQLKSSGEQ